MLCPRCGMRIPENSQYCDACGANLAAKQKLIDRRAKGNLAPVAQAASQQTRAAKAPIFDAAFAKESFVSLFNPLLNAVPRFLALQK